MTRTDLLPRFVLMVPTLALWAGLDALAVVVLYLGGGAATDYALAGAVHLLAVAVVWTSTPVSPSHRVLLAAVALALPIVGVAVAALVLATPGRGEMAEALIIDPPLAPQLTAADWCRLVDSVPACETLVSANREHRRATLTLLSRRGDAASVGLLRWAVTGRDSDLAIEAALVLEELGAQFDVRAAASRLALDSQPGFDTALAAADTLAEAIHSGLADPSLMAPLTWEARRCYGRAEVFAPERLPEVAVKWARLELAASRPTLALAVLERARAAGGGEPVETLRTQVDALAARRATPALHQTSL